MRCRTPTRCDAARRWPGPRATRSTSRATSPRWSCHRPSTTRSFSRAEMWSRTGTSTASRSPSPRIFWPSPPPRLVGPPAAARPAARAIAGHRRGARRASQDGGRGGPRPRGRAGARRGGGSDPERRRHRGGGVRDRTASVSRTIRAPRGAEITCQGWPQEAAMRMLMNNLDPEVAERPEDLVVYGGTGRAARSWEAYDAIVTDLERLQGDQTLLVQSGKPVGVFDTHEWAPRVLIANSLLVPEWATWEEFRRLEAKGLTMYGQMTAGSWIYIGTQGILQGTYETFAAIARKRFHDSLAGTI